MDGSSVRAWAQFIWSILGTICVVVLFLESAYVRQVRASWGTARDIVDLQNKDKAIDGRIDAGNDRLSTAISKINAAIGELQLDVRELKAVMSLMQKTLERISQ